MLLGGSLPASWRLLLCIALAPPPGAHTSEFDVPDFGADFFTKPTEQKKVSEYLKGGKTLGESAAETKRLSGRDSSYWLYPDVRFYTNGLCPYSQRVALALLWMEIPHVRVEIDLSLSADDLGWYRKRLGTAAVPALEVDTIPHHGSLELLRLLTVYAKPGLRFVPQKRNERVAVEELLGCFDEIEQAGWDLIGGSGDDGRDISPGVAAAHWSHRWEKVVERLNSALFMFGGPYLVGDRPTAADATIAPFLARFDLIARELKGYDMREAVPRLGRYLTMLESGEAWRRSFPKRAPFLAAIEHYGRLDYFLSHTASLEHPMPGMPERRLQSGGSRADVPLQEAPERRLQSGVSAAEETWPSCAATGDRIGPPEQAEAEWGWWLQLWHAELARWVAESPALRLVLPSCASALAEELAARFDAALALTRPAAWLDGVWPVRATSSRKAAKEECAAFVEMPVFPVFPVGMPFELPLPPPRLLLQQLLPQAWMHT